MKNERLLKVLGKLPKSPTVAGGFFLIPVLGVIDYFTGYGFHSGCST